jgi:hypothetical protein
MTQDRTNSATGFDAGGSVVNTVEAYDPVADTWAPKASMGEARTFLAAAMASGVLYALGGDNTSTILPTNEAYTP